MLKTLRVPERLFQIAMWLVSFVFAGFLIGLGGKVVGDLPGVEKRLDLEQFLDPTQVARNRFVQDSLGRVEVAQGAARERAQLRLTTAANVYRNARQSFDNWIRTRTATTDPNQDPQVLQRTRELDGLKAAEQSAQAEVDRLNGALLLVSDQPMIPEGIKTELSDRSVTENFVEIHISIGIEALKLIRRHGKSVKHLRFDE